MFIKLNFSNSFGAKSKTMKVLQTVQWSLALMGYKNSQRHTFSKQQVHHAFVALLILTSLCAYPIYDAITIPECIYSVFMITTIGCLFISFVSTASKTATIFDFIGKVEKIIDDGEKQHLNDYFETNLQLKTLTFDTHIKRGE